MTHNSKSYADNYETLELINKKLQSEQDNPNVIDDLEKMLEQSSKSYMICKERLDAAETLILDFENKVGHGDESQSSK